ncbi:MAG: hypothetical protein LBU25_02810, partial [Treponema sp.]|nr:hypothetical protein [Treponema sp.]
FVANDPFATIIEKIYVHGPKFLEFITESRGQEYGLAKNAVDTAVLSLGIARAMKLADLDVTCNTLLIRLLAS